MFRVDLLGGVDLSREFFTVWTDLFMDLTLFQGLELVIDVVRAVAYTWLTLLLFLLCRAASEVDFSIIILYLRYAWSFQTSSVWEYC